MIYFMKEKSEAFNKFKQYKNFIEVQTGKKLKVLRVDGGGEYLSNEFKKFLLDNGIRLQVTAPHSPSQNGIAERLNRTLVEHGRAMIHSHGLPNCLWREAIAYANDLKNVSPTRAIKGFKTPDEVFWKKKPDISHLEEFGRDCSVLQQDGANSKLDPKLLGSIQAPRGTSTTTPTHERSSSPGMWNSWRRGRRKLWRRRFMLHRLRGRVQAAIAFQANKIVPRHQQPRNRL
jgi:transposase InsO family protein